MRAGAGRAWNRHLPQETASWEFCWSLVAVFFFWTCLFIYWLSPLNGNGWNYDSMTSRLSEKADSGINFQFSSWRRIHQEITSSWTSRLHQRRLSSSFRWAQHLGWNDVILRIEMLHIRNTIVPGTETNKHWWGDGSLYRCYLFPFAGVHVQVPLFVFALCILSKDVLLSKAFKRCRVYCVSPIFREQLGSLKDVKPIFLMTYSILVSQGPWAFGGNFKAFVGWICMPSLSSGRTFSQNCPPNKYRFNKASQTYGDWWLHFLIFMKVDSSDVLRVKYIGKFTEHSQSKLTLPTIPSTCKVSPL